MNKGQINFENTKVEELFQLLTALKNSLDVQMMQQFNRSLPLNELLFDRWERARKLGFGEESSVYDCVCIYGNVKVGKHTWVGPFSILDGTGNLEIGDYCSISAGVQIYTHDSVDWATSGGIKPYSYGSTKIGSNCYIGPNTIISKGITIGDGTIIGANSFVNKSFPRSSKIAGSPARVI